MTDADLVDDLQRYPQVGPERAREIIALVRGAGPGADVDAAREAVELARERHVEGRGEHREFVRSYLDQALDALGGDDA